MPGNVLCVLSCRAPLNPWAWDAAFQRGTVLRSLRGLQRRHLADIDPGIILHLLQGMAPNEVAGILYARSGLLGVSGISDDVRILEASDDPCAAEALDLFAYRVVREIGSLMAALGGLDVLVFTAGIGEHSSRLRYRIAQGLAWTGLTLDRECNARPALRINAAGSTIDAFVIPTNEEFPIAEAARRLV